MSDQTEYETEYEGSDDENVPDDAPEADVLEQRQASTVPDDRSEQTGLPNEADPADVDEQRHEVGADDEDDYR